MRVISGMRRGMKLKAPEGMDTRPTTDRVKESVFNLLQFALPFGRVLDLFAGSGALGIEALSRNAEKCVFVDASAKVCACVRENLSSARFMDRAEIHNTTANAFLGGCTEGFDLIFLDPPYNQGFLTPILTQIEEKGLLNENGVLLMETERGGETFPCLSFSVRKSVCYGKTQITILQKVKS